MRKKIEKLVNREVDDEVYCNKCGENCFIEEMEGKKYFEGEEVVVCGEWASKHLVDGIIYKFDLCEKCLVELMDTFIILPELSGSSYQAFNDYKETKEYTYKDLREDQKKVNK